MTEIFKNTKEALLKRGFDAYIAKNAEEARALVLSMIPKGESITWGGSATLAELGLPKLLKEGDYCVFDREDVPPAERNAFSRQHFFSDWFLMSANAVTEEGELFNIDGNGNRVASLIFGPKNVIVLVGKNKITPDLRTAEARAREVAAPRNAARFPITTPCKRSGSCADCLSPDTICASFVRTRICKPQGRIKVILIDEILGF